MNKIITPDLQKRINLLTKPPPIDQAIQPARWLRGYYDEDHVPRGFFMPKEGTVGYDFMIDASEESFVEGPFAVGKSQILAFKVHNYCLKNPGSRCGFLRKTKESVKGSIAPTYYRILGYDPTQSSLGYVKGYGGANPQRYIYRNGSVIHILGLNRLDDFLSTEFHCMGIPQAEELTQDEWELVSRRTRLGGRSLVFGDVNPSFEQHFLNNSPHIKRYKMRHEENPEYYDYYTGDLTAKGESEIAKLQRMTGVRYKRGYLGIWCAQEGVVYSMYEPELHAIEVTRDDFGVDTKWNMSVDYGFQNAWAANFWAFTPQGVHIHFKEIYRSLINLDEFIARIRKVRDDYRIDTVGSVFADHNAEHNDRMEIEGFPIVKAEKEILPGIELVKEHLENGTLKFNRHSLVYFKDEHGNREGEDENLFGHPKCMQDELGVYAYRPLDKRTFTEKDEYPVDYGNHAMDSMRYYIKGMDQSDVYFPISESFDPVAMGV